MRTLWGEIVEQWREGKYYADKLKYIESLIKDRSSYLGSDDFKDLPVDRRRDLKLDHHGAKVHYSCEYEKFKSRRETLSRDRKRFAERSDFYRERSTDVVIALIKIIVTAHGAAAAAILAALAQMTPVDDLWSPVVKLLWASAGGLACAGLGAFFFALGKGRRSDVLDTIARFNSTERDVESVGYSDQAHFNTQRIGLGLVLFAGVVLVVMILSAAHAVG